MEKLGTDGDDEGTVGVKDKVWPTRLRVVPFIKMKYKRKSRFPGVDEFTLNVLIFFFKLRCT